MWRAAYLAAGLASRASRQVPATRATHDDALPPLKFDDEGVFRISVFSDLHFGQGESGTGPDQDRNTIRAMEDVLDLDGPQLVVLNGDLIDGESARSRNGTHYVDQLVGPMVRRNLTWASTYGNHDHSHDADSDDIWKQEKRWPGARTQRMVTAQGAGITNYYLVVNPPTCAGDGDGGGGGCVPELVLWFFDSRGGFHFQGAAQGNWVHASVVAWANETNASLARRYKRAIPSLAFVHIPVHATEGAAPEPHHQPGINDELPVAQQGEGWCGNDTPDEEGCDYGGQDVPFMRALVGMPGLMGLFYGHDHGKSWCYRWDSLLPGMDVAGSGLNLCYGQHSGYGGYGDWIRGARQIVVTRDKLADLTVDTYIRLESGAVVGAVSLNSTFNHDYYPATPDQRTYVDQTVNGKVRVYPSASSRLRPGRELGYCKYAVAACVGLWAVLSRVL
ncbi:Metallophosphoesterase domain protein [Metarhizium album ARSEF 1941]|uniref:Metallophosphoesterase domain protein n=1 Tax=Metarhizium album (strain ARSEF 1941) TaxID=1081103 RepID=A0A0B2WJ05_METAS|nr:Metallophosphoesterase domain protein [Metarhizium album ARSEF 1941]KHN93833.1 Metallophosphoesterase domain protein [Metarhizium album ARSEF 1941]